MEPISTWLRSRTSLEHLAWFLWSFLLISIPVTSSPLVAKLTGGSTVSGLAGIPIAILFVIWFLPNIINRGKIHLIWAPLILFIAVAILASALAPGYEIYPFLGRSVTERSLRGALTLFIGVSFYMVASSFPCSSSALRLSLRWLYLGAALMLAWASMQAFFLVFDRPIPSFMFRIHEFLSIRDLHTQRVTGFAYEPSWMANQLVILYIPLWVSSVVKGYSIFNRNPKRLSVELGLLIWGAIVLFFSFSRIGLVSGFVILGWVVLGLGWTATGRLAGKIRDRWKVFRKIAGGVGVNWFRAALWLLLILLLLIIMFSLVIVASRLDARIARIIETNYFEIIRTSSDPVYAISRRLAYAERVAYWRVGFRVFSQYPLLGVGLGNTGFFFRQFLPAYGHRLPETIRILNGSPQFPNAKNLWVRLLAETGIVGFMTFTVWMFVLALGAWYLIKHRKGICSVLGMAGLLALAAQIFEGFSLDTFALPQLWIMMGFVTAALSLPSADQALAIKSDSNLG